MARLVQAAGAAAERNTGWTSRCSTARARARTSATLPEQRLCRSWIPSCCPTLHPHSVSHRLRVCSQPEHDVDEPLLLGAAGPGDAELVWPEQGGPHEGPLRHHHLVLAEAPHARRLSVQHAHARRGLGEVSCALATWI